MNHNSSCNNCLACLGCRFLTLAVESRPTWCLPFTCPAVKGSTVHPEVQRSNQTTLDVCIYDCKLLEELSSTALIASCWVQVHTGSIFVLKPVWRRNLVPWWCLWCASWRSSQRCRGTWAVCPGWTLHTAAVGNAQTSSGCSYKQRWRWWWRRLGAASAPTVGKNDSWIWLFE